MTEKVYNGLQSGTLPVYWGAKNVEDFVPRGSVVKVTFPSVFYVFLFRFFYIWIFLKFFVTSFPLFFIFSRFVQVFPSLLLSVYSSYLFFYFFKSFWAFVSFLSCAFLFFCSYFFSNKYSFVFELVIKSVNPRSLASWVLPLAALPPQALSLSLR